MMKMKQLEKLILLEESGELSVRQRRTLEQCPEADDVRKELTAFLNSVPVLEEEPSAWAATKIASRLRSKPNSLFEFSRLWKPALALAACLTIFVNSFDFRQTSSASTVVQTVEVDVWDDQFEEDLAELETLILAISGDPLDIMEM